MLTEKRYELILKLLDEQNSVTVAEIKEKLKISESTIRRDLNALDKAGKLNKVFGGAVAIEAGITTAEPSVAQKKGVNKEEKQLALDAMDKMQITQLARRCYRELSGGQQQRVLLARALCATRKMLLLDEPVSGLDPKVTAEMYALIEKLNCEDGITVIMISHDIAAAVQYASHILHIGDTVFFGTKADYLESPQGRLFDAKEGGDNQ